MIQNPEHAKPPLMYTHPAYALRHPQQFPTKRSILDADTNIPGYPDVNIARWPEQGLKKELARRPDDRSETEFLPHSQKIANDIMASVEKACSLSFF